MKNLISLNVKELVPRHVTAAKYRAHCGMLTSPGNSKNPLDAIALGAAWAADNDCFVEFNPRRILGWLERNRHLASSCLWFNAPDVIQNATGTLFQFWIWEPIIRAYGFKVAFTLQNGMEQHQIPWDYCDALFIGGDDTFKRSEYIREVAKQANQRGVWIHQGRCNTIGRITRSKAIGCNSFDGTNYTRYPFDVKNHLRLHQTPDYQLMLEGIA